LLENIAHMFVYQGVTDETCGCAAPLDATCPAGSGLPGW